MDNTDFIAIIIVFSMLIFKITGHDGDLDTAVAIIVGYYFGKKNELNKQNVIKT